LTRKFVTVAKDSVAEPIEAEHRHALDPLHIGLTFWVRGAVRRVRLNPMVRRLIESATTAHSNISPPRDTARPAIPR